MRDNNEKPKASKFRPGQKIFAFEVGEAVFVREGDFDVEHNDVRIEFKVGDIMDFHFSTWCFARSLGGWYHRDWTLGKAKLRIRYHPGVHEIEIVLLSAPCRVQYSENPNDCEYFESGDPLHQDWEGLGIDFAGIINKWLKRLNGDQIALSDYFKNPVNRWLDGGKPVQGARN